MTVKGEGKREILSCLIGGIKQDIIVEGDLNIMTRALFRKMRIEKFSYYSSQLQAVEVNGKNFCGSVITNVKSNNASVLTQFYVADVETIKDPIISEEYAKKLKANLNLIPCIQPIKTLTSLREEAKVAETLD
jgi:hypothetical protein